MQVMHQLHGKQMMHRLFLGAVFLRKGEAKAATWPRRDCPVVVTPEPAGEAVADSDTRKRGVAAAAEAWAAAIQRGDRISRREAAERVTCSHASIGQAPRLVSKE